MLRVALVALLFASSAFAQDSTANPWQLLVVGRMKFISM